MMNTKKISALLAAVLAVAAALIYRGVLYRYQPVYYMLIGAAVLACLRFLLAGSMPTLAAYLPIGAAALFASAFVWGTSLMVNQLGYVYAGLDPVSTVMSWIWFAALCLIGMILSIVASFRRAA